MKTSAFLLVTLLALCLMPSALALKCQECTNVPGYSASSQCSDEEVGSITCEAFLDRCMTIKGTITVPDVGPFDFVLKNCSNSLACDPGSPITMCKVLNMTGLMTDCSTECCEGDMCNGAVRISGVLSSFAAIMLALVFSLFPGVY